MQMKTYPKTIPITGRVRCCVELLRSQKLKGNTLLDVGSTFGWLANEVKGEKLKEYIGIEPNTFALNFAKKNAKQATFLSGDAAHIPVEKNKADLAVFFDVIEHVPQNSEVECLNEIHRVLKPNGTLLLSTPFDHPFTKMFDPAWYRGHRHYSRKKLQTLLKKSGFKIKTFEVRGTYVSVLYMIVFYVAKWILRTDINGTWIQKLDDKSYNQRGIATIYLVAQKTG